MKIGPVGPILYERPFGMRPMTLIGETSASAAADLIKDGTDQGFMADVIETSKTTPVIVDF